MVRQICLNWTIGLVHSSPKVVKEPDRTEPWQHYAAANTHKRNIEENKENKE